MEGKRPPDKKNEVLEVNGIAYVENRDKAEQFAKTYRGFSKLTEDITAADLTQEQKVKIKENTMKTEHSDEDSG